MAFSQRKTSSLSKAQKHTCHESLQTETFDVKTPAATVCASSTPLPLSASAQSVERSAPAERVEPSHRTLGTSQAEQQTEHAVKGERSASVSPSGKQQQRSASAVDPSQQGGRTCGSALGRTQGEAVGSAEPKHEGVDWKAARKTESSVSGEDEEEISLNGSRGSELTEKAAMSEIAHAPLTEQVCCEKGGAASAAGERSRVGGFRWRRQGGKQHEELRENRDAGEGEAKGARRPSNCKSTRKDFSPESAILNALARWKLMFLPMKDWEDERKARSTVVSRLLGQLTGALAAISADSNVSTACMLRLLEARTKATFDYARSLQQSCVLISRRHGRPPETVASDLHSTSRSTSTNPAVTPFTVHPSETGIFATRQGTNFDSGCCSSILFTFPGEGCSNSVAVNRGVPQRIPDLSGSDRRELVDSSLWVAAHDASYVGRRYAGSFQHADRMTESRVCKGRQKGSDAAFRTLSASTCQTQNDANILFIGSKVGDNAECDDNTRISRASSCSTAQRGRKETTGRRRAAGAKFKVPSVRAEACLAPPVDTHPEGTGGVDRTRSSGLDREPLPGESRIRRTLYGNDGELLKYSEEYPLGDCGLLSVAFSKSRTGRSTDGLKEKKGMWRFGKTESAADAATGTSGTVLSSRLSLRPWVLLLLKMTQRSSLHMEALELSEENCLLQESLRVIRSDYERAAAAQLNAVRRRALEAGTAHQSCCAAWNAYKQAFEGSARVSVSTRGMSVQLPLQHTQQPLGRASSMLGLTSSGSATGNACSCSWFFERKYVLAAKKAQEQELEHVREVLRAVLALENLERWRYDTLREDMVRFFSKVRQCLTTVCAAVDFYLFDVLDSRALARADTSCSSVRLGSQLMIPGSLASEPALLSAQQPQKTQQSLGRWLDPIGGTREVQEQKQRVEEEEKQQPRRPQRRLRTSSVLSVTSTAGLVGRRPSPTKIPPSHCRQSFSSASVASPEGARASPARRGLFFAFDGASCARLGASAASVRDAAALSSRRGKRVTDATYLRRAEAVQAKNSETVMLRREGGRRKQRHSLQHARSAGVDEGVGGDSLARGPASGSISKAASLPLLGESDRAVVRRPASASRLFAETRAAGSTSSLRRKKKPVRGGNVLERGKKRDTGEAISDAQAAEYNQTSSTSASSKSRKNAALGSSGSSGSSSASVADEGDQEEALVAAALSSAAAAEEESSSSDSAHSGKSKDSPTAVLRQSGFSIDRASVSRAAPSTGIEEETKRSAAESQDEGLSEDAEAAEEGTDGDAEGQKGEGRKKGHKGEREGDGGDIGEGEEEDPDAHENSDDLPALQSKSSSNIVFSSTASCIDLWWLLRRCELLGETGGKVPPCLCKSSIVKIAKHLRYPAIPASVTLLKSEQVQRLSTAGPPFSRATQRWKDGYLLLTWDRFLFMFRDQAASLSGEPSFLWTASLPGAEIRKIKKEPPELPVIEVREKKRRFSLRRTSVVFRPLTEQACEEWATTLRVVAKDSVFLSAAADRGEIACLSFENLPSVSRPVSPSGKSPLVLRPEVLSDTAPVITNEPDPTSCSVPAAGSAADTLTSRARFPSVSFASSTRSVWYEDGRRGNRVSSPLSAFVSVDETTSSAESEVRSSCHTLESGLQERSGSMSSSLVGVSHRLNKTDDGPFSNRARTEHLPVVGGATATPLNSPLSTLKASDSSASAVAVSAGVAAGAKTGGAAAGGTADP